MAVIAQSLDQHIVKITGIRSPQFSARAFQGIGRKALRLFPGIHSDEATGRDQFPAIRISRAGLVTIRSSLTGGTDNREAVLAELLHFHGAQVNERTRPDVGLRVANLVEHLRPDRADIDDAARALWLGNDDAAVARNPGNRIADLVHAVRDA